MPHKAVAEVSRFLKIGNYRSGVLLWFIDGRANPLVDWKVVAALRLSISRFFLLFVFLQLWGSFLMCLLVSLSIHVSDCSASWFAYVFITLYYNLQHPSIRQSIYLAVLLLIHVSICLSFKSGRNVVSFSHFRFEQLKFQKCYAAVLLPFWLRNVLRARTACIFSCAQLPKVLQAKCVFWYFDSEMCFAPQRLRREPIRSLCGA